MVEAHGITYLQYYLLKCYNINPLNSVPTKVLTMLLIYMLVSVTYYNGPPHLSRAEHKRKISQIVLNTNTYFVLNCNVLALFTFYALPSGGKLKNAVVHYTFILLVFA